MRMPSLFPSRAASAAVKRSVRSRRGTLRSRQRGLGSWERLGLGMGGVEQFEQRAMMAADLVVTLNDNIAANVDRTFYSPASQVVYTLTLENKGDATATDAVLQSSFASAITQKTWTAAYTGGATGDTVGAGNLNAKVTLPASGKAVFTIVASVGAAATGDLVSSATVSTVEGETDTANNTASDTDRFVPRSLAVADDAGWSSTSLVRLVNPSTGAMVAQAFAFEPDLRTGVRTAVGDLDADGKNEVVAVSSYGRTAEVVVLQQNVASDGTITLVKDARYTLQPFGRSYDRGLGLVVGDFTADGRDDIAVSQAYGGGIQIYESTPTAPSGPLTAYRSFVAFPGSTSGVAIAAADFGTVSGGRVVDAVRRDGKAELVVASGVGMAPVVRVYDVSTAVPAVVDTIRPFSNGFVGGMSVTTGRVNVDSTPDIIMSQGRGGSSLVEVYDGRLGQGTNARLARFAAFADLVTRAAPVVAAGVDTDGDGRLDRLDVVQGGVGQASLRHYSTAGVRQGGLAGLAGAQELAAAAARSDKGLITTSTGLQYRELVVGTGASPTKDTDRVTVDYAGYLLDGTRFDGNQGMQFTLNGVIKGWTEGLKTMKIGGITQFIIPADLAYGSTPRPGIPANSTLVFSIKLNAIA